MNIDNYKVQNSSEISLLIYEPLMRNEIARKYRITRDEIITYFNNEKKKIILKHQPKEKNNILTQRLITIGDIFDLKEKSEQKCPKYSDVLADGKSVNLSDNSRTYSALSNKFCTEIPMSKKDLNLSLNLLTVPNKIIKQNNNLSKSKHVCFSRSVCISDDHNTNDTDIYYNTYILNKYHWHFISSQIQIHSQLLQNLRCRYGKDASCPDSWINYIEYESIFDDLYVEFYEQIKQIYTLEKIERDNIIDEFIIELKNTQEYEVSSFFSDSYNLSSDDELNQNNYTDLDNKNIENTYYIQYRNLAAYHQMTSIY